MSQTRQQIPSSTDSSSISTLRAPALVVALAAAIGAIYQIVVAGPPGATYVSFADYVRELSFLTYLVATLVAIRAARNVGLITRTPSWLIVIGYGLLAVGVTFGLAVRDDPDWFFLLGGPGILLSTIGFVAWGIIAGRTKVFPWWLAALCIVGSLIAVLGAELGAGAVIAVFWAIIAARTRSSQASSS